jgi:hypothetical protein
MNRPLFTVRASALILTALLALPASAQASLSFLCAMSGAVVPACCCNHGSEGAASETSQWSTAPCCVAIDTSSGAAVSGIDAAHAGPQVPLQRRVERRPTNPKFALNSGASKSLGARAPPPLHRRPLTVVLGRFLL